MGNFVRTSNHSVIKTSHAEEVVTDAGSGRKPGSVAKRHKVVVEDSSSLMPVEWMLAVLRDPEAEQSRRDQMAALAAPYRHPRLNAVATSHVNGGNGDGDVGIGIVNIFAVPRGARVSQDGSAISIDGTPVELSTITPFEGSPPLELTDQREQTSCGSIRRRSASRSALRLSRLTPVT